jgi:hypothetical protein
MLPLETLYRLPDPLIDSASPHDVADVIQLLRERNPVPWPQKCKSNTLWSIELANKLATNHVITRHFALKLSVTVHVHYL